MDFLFQRLFISQICSLPNRFTIKTPDIIRIKLIIVKMLGLLLNFTIPTKEVPIIHNPLNVAQEIPARRNFITWDNRYIHNIIVIILQIEGINLVKSFIPFAKELGVVPHITASINTKYGNILLNKIN